ncbi:hypothetical protein WESB_1034 [Brachyspira pilosicoli WesB]|uniref:Lipoprotein n=1 Tax=Brachyspira pilosicoli WesB TaxID=1161918 RepID=K0JFI3_BRAPL|nr:hypothetical protein [Brachyspira pilosicoli]CCG56503.1 hypothetical protein WESB_1034 [Brachyspira pilosicoli WesB]
MKKFLLIISIISMAAISCADSNGAGGATESLVTKNIPSLNKSQKTGTANTQSSVSLSVSAQATAQAAGDIAFVENKNPATGTYSVLERLYSTTWYQSESDYDDGKLETEETFIFFNENSEVVEREYENGVLDGRDEYSTLTWVADITVPAGNVDNLTGEKSRNACIVKNTEKDDDRDTDYEAYYLSDENTLYIVDGNNESQVIRELEELIKNIANNSPRAYGDKYVLSVKAK